MKEKINLVECMKRKCEQCKNYKSCFKGEKMLIKAKRIDNLEMKVNEYKNKLVVKYLNLKGYNCDISRVSVLKVYSQLKKNNLKVIIDTENEKFSRLGSYYTWEAYVKVKIVDIITGKEV